MDDNDARFELRLPAALKRAFLEASKRQDRDGAQLVRDFIRQYVKDHAQADLLSHAKPARRKGS